MQGSLCLRPLAFFSTVEGNCIFQFSTAFECVWIISAFGVTELAYVAAVSPLNL